MQPSLSGAGSSSRSPPASSLNTWLAAGERARTGLLAGWSYLSGARFFLKLKLERRAAIRLVREKVAASKPQLNQASAHATSSFWLALARSSIFYCSRLASRKKGEEEDEEELVVERDKLARCFVRASRATDRPTCRASICSARVGISKSSAELAWEQPEYESCASRACCALAQPQFSWWVITM